MFLSRWPWICALILLGLNSKAFSSPRPAFEKAQKQLLDNQYKKAARGFRKILRKYPKHTPSRVQLALSLYYLEDFDGSYKVFQKVSPQNLPSRAYFEYAYVHYLKENWDTAGAYFVVIGPKHPLIHLAHYYAGVAYYNLNNDHLAYEYLKKATILPQRFVGPRRDLLKMVKSRLNSHKANKSSSAYNSNTDPSLIDPTLKTPRENIKAQTPRVRRQQKRDTPFTLRPKAYTENYWLRPSYNNSAASETVYRSLGAEILAAYQYQHSSYRVSTGLSLGSESVTTPTPSGIVLPDELESQRMLFYRGGLPVHLLHSIEASFSYVHQFGEWSAGVAAKPSYTTGNDLLAEYINSLDTSVTLTHASKIEKKLAIQFSSLDSSESNEIQSLVSHFGLSYLMQSEFRLYGHIEYGQFKFGNEQTEGPSASAEIEVGLDYILPFHFLMQLASRSYQLESYKKTFAPDVSYTANAAAYGLDLAFIFNHEEKFILTAGKTLNIYRWTSLSDPIATEAWNANMSTRDDIGHVSASFNWTF